VDDLIRPRRHLTARLLWTAESPLVVGGNYLLKLGGLETQATVAALHHGIDINGFGPAAAETLGMNGIGIASLSLDRPAVLTDYVRNRTLGGFILIDRLSHETVAFGLVDLDADTRALEPRGGASIGVSRIQCWLKSDGEQPRRSLLKAVTWRITGSIDTFLLSWLFTRSIGVAAAISATEVITKLVLYYGHERIWARSKFGLHAGSRGGENMEGAGI
jgi:sulfate adenylyltransferase subunit 1 (EFTu-like GTPase family)